MFFAILSNVVVRDHWNDWILFVIILSHYYQNIKCFFRMSNARTIFFKFYLNVCVLSLDLCFPHKYLNPSRLNFANNPAKLSPTTNEVPCDWDIYPEVKPYKK